MSTRRELVWALVAIVAISGLYAGVSYRIGVPAARSFFGHSIGVLGFLLMLATETLYSLRKRAMHRALGRMSDWLQFHIFTGIVGPYLVFLHSAFAFRGLAGVVMLMTAVVVVSGFVGRYIYTAVPRTADGLIVEAEELQRAVRAAEAELAALEGPQAGGPLGSAQGGSTLVLARALQDLGEAWSEAWRDRRLEASAREQRRRIERARRQLRERRRQLASLAAARRLLAVWHSVHIPLGMALFVAAFAHAAAALYFATLLR